MSARFEPLLFQSMTRCHSVFSCFSPAVDFHWRLVARESVATRPPFEVLRTSGSVPRLPINVTLLRLRLMGCPPELWIISGGWNGTLGSYRSAKLFEQPNIRPESP